MDTKKIVHAAFYIALGIVLPMAFHIVGAGGRVFLPMHIPVLLGGMGLGPLLGFLIGLLTPLLSSLLTGMPPVLPTLPLMMGELATYGLVAGVSYKRYKYNVYVSLLLALVGGRMVNLLLFWLLGQNLGLHINLADFLAGMFVVGLPGIGLQLVLIPLLVKRLERISFH